MRHNGIVIFDLDGTTIDSSHRALTRPDGSLDLDHWRENCTAEKIANDTTMPLAEIWRSLHSGIVRVICTARVMSEHDFAMLRSHGLSAHFCFSRPPNDRGTPDDLLKVQYLHPFLDREDMRNLPAVMFDDSPTVRGTLRRLGFPVIHPKRIESRLGNERV